MRSNSPPSHSSSPEPPTLFDAIVNSLSSHESQLHSPDGSGHSSPTTKVWPLTSDFETQHDLTTPSLRHLGPTAPIPGYQRVDFRHRDRRDSVSTSTSSSSAASSPPDSPQMDLPHIHTSADYPYASSHVHVHAFEGTEGNYSHLFDPKRPRYPHPDLIVHFTSLFFDKLASHFPFMDHNSTMMKVMNGTMPSILSNSIAALSSR